MGVRLVPFVSRTRLKKTRSTRAPRVGRGEKGNGTGSEKKRARRSLQVRGSREDLFLRPRRGERNKHDVCVAPVR